MCSKAKRLFQLALGPVMMLLALASSGAWAQEERDALFALLIGILMLVRSGRARSVGTEADKLLQTGLRSLRLRLVVS